MTFTCFLSGREIQDNSTVGAILRTDGPTLLIGEKAFYERLAEPLLRDKPKIPGLTRLPDDFDDKIGVVWVLDLEEFLTHASQKQAQFVQDVLGSTITAPKIAAVALSEKTDRIHPFRAVHVGSSKFFTGSCVLH